MTAPADDVQTWSRLRWGTSIAGVIALHFVLLAALGGVARKPVKFPVSLQVALPQTVPEELQALTDPTLFALGGPHGFSSVWMAPPVLPPVDSTGPHPPQWLSLEAASLGGDFVEFARANAAPLHGLTFKTAPQPLPSEVAATPAPLRQRSRLRLTDDLAERRLLSAPELPPQSAGDLLAPSEVRVTVDARGTVTSAILLPPGSGSPEADRFAVEQAEQIQFSPLPSAGINTPLTLGRVIFEWLTVPFPASTNAPSQ